MAINEVYNAVSGVVVRGGYFAATGPTVSGSTSMNSFVPSGTVTPSDAGSPAAPTSSAKYRSGRSQLFNDLALATELVAASGSTYETPARAGVPNALPYNWGSVGPTWLSVDAPTGWAWLNAGGDFIDTTNVPQATGSPHFSFAANNVSSGTFTYTTSILAGVQASYAQQRFNAYIVRSSHFSRAIATRRTPSVAAPFISVTYNDGSTATLACTCCTPFNASTSFTLTGSQYASLEYGAALEFERPIKPVTAATLNIVVFHQSATAATIRGYLVNPRLNTNPVVLGLAEAYPLDVGISANANVIHSHRYQDGTVIGDWVWPYNVNRWAGDQWSPHLFGLGAADTSKLPYAWQGNPILGKWEGNGNFSLVNSSYTGEGFAPLAPGLGAIKVLIPKGVGVDGTPLGYGGGYGCHLTMYIPEAESGLLNEMYYRFYMRIGENGTPKTIANTKMFRVGSVEAPGTAVYAVKGGKFGLGPTHWSHYGGNNNVGGNTLGWSSRYAWKEIPLDSKDSGIVPGVHTYDNIGYDFSLGRDGLSAAWYKNEWYCIEGRLKLNTWAAGGGGPSDGEMDTWIDGRLVNQQRNFKFRDGPIDISAGGLTPYTSGTRPAFREIGIVDITMNLYIGGVLPADEDTHVFHTGLVTSKSYIGPMKLSPSWLPATANTVAAVGEVNSFASINPGNSPAGGYSYSQGGTLFDMSLAWAKIINDYSGGAFNPHYQHTPGIYGCMVFHGGGHSATNWNGIVIFDFNSRQYYIVCPGSASNVYPGSAATSEYADGQPASPHSYDTLAVIGPERGYSKGALISIYRGGAFVENQLPSASVHVFDFNNQSVKWQRLYSAGGAGWSDAFGIGHSCAYDPVLGRIWWVGQGNEVGYTAYFDLTDNTQKKATITSPLTNGPPNSNPDSKLMLFVPGRRVNVLTDTVSYSNLTRRIFYHDTLNPAAGWTQANLSSAFPADYGFAMDWHPASGKIYCYCVQDPTAVYTLAIPTTLSSTWTVTRIVIASGSLDGFYVIGKRFAFSETIGGFLHKGQASTSMKVYRP